MNCKNCEAPLAENATFCNQCGAPVITKRITIKRLWNSIADQFFGWDNKYLLTIFTMIRKPELVLGSYLDGTRKKFMAPFAFLAFYSAISVLVFNYYSDNYLDIIDSWNQKQMSVIENSVDPENKAEVHNAQMAQLESTKKIQSFVVKYMNFITFSFIPFFALLSFLVFRKPYNYGEHLVITTYIQGFISVTSLILFILSVKINPIFFSFSFLFMMIYYLYAYGKLYEYRLGKLIVMLFKFIGIILIMTIAIVILAFAIGLIMAKLGVIKQ